MRGNIGESWEERAARRSQRGWMCDERGDIRVQMGRDGSGARRDERG